MAIYKKEDKIHLLALGRWKKCANSKCPNPANRNAEGSFCSKKCRFNDPQVIEYYRNATRKRDAIDGGSYRKKAWATQEARDKASTKHKKHWKENYDFRYSKISEGLTRLATREKVAYAKALRDTLGPIKSHYKSPKGLMGSENSIPCRNPLDKTAYRSLDDNPRVRSWKAFEIRIPFLKKDRYRHSFAVVDLEVIYTDGTKKLIDIREGGISDVERFKLIDRWCSKNGYVYDVWTKESFTQAW